MKKCGKLIKRIGTTIMVCALILSTTATSASAIVNPGTIQWRAGNYFIYLPTSPSDYTFERVGNALMNIKSPALGYASAFIKKSYSAKLTASDISTGEKTLQGIVGDGLDSLPKDVCKRLSKTKGLLGTMSEINTTATDLKTFKKNDTTNYELNYVLGTQVNLISKSSLGAIAKYNYASVVLNPLIKSGDIKITWAKKWESTLRTKVTYSAKAKQQITKLRKDLEVINKEFEKRKIK